jgi:ankyrin repeat protein
MNESRSIVCVASGFSRKFNASGPLPPKGGSHTRTPKGGSYTRTPEGGSHTRNIHRLFRVAGPVAVAFSIIVCGNRMIAAAAPPSELLTAVRTGDAAAVRALVRKRADVNAADVDGTTALHWAVRADDQPTAALLVSAGADVNVANRYGVTALSIAARNGNPSLLQLLIDSGARTGAADARLPDGQTLLMHAARTGSAEAVSLLIKQGADVNARERRLGATALIWAVSEDRAAAARVLLNAGANPNARSAVTRYPHTPPAVVGDALEEGVSYVGQTVLPKGEWTPLMYAARQGALAAARVLIDSRADLNLTDPDGTSALMFAIINGHYDVAELLLERGADVNLPDRTGMTPLYAAVDMHTLAFTFGRPDLTHTTVEATVGMIQTLLSYGADPNASLKMRILKRVYNAGDPRLGEGATPLMRAARGGDAPVMRMLIDQGADPGLLQTNGNSLLILAVGSDGRGRDGEDAEAGKLEAIAVCFDIGVPVNAANAAGDTAAHLAATSKSASSKVIELLVQHGVKFDVKNKAGRTPLDAALRARDTDPEKLTLLRRLTPEGPSSDSADTTGR